MPSSSEREVAVSVLNDVTENGAYNSIALRRALGARADMSAVSRAFVTELVNGTLRNMIYIDYVIGLRSSVPVSRMKPFILNVLRAGVYQLVFMDRVPDFAAVNESVKLVKRAGYQSLAPFVNGVLRAVARGKDDIPLPDRRKEPARYLSVKYSCPEWLIEYWLKDMSLDAVERMCAANNEKPRVTVCVNTLKTGVSALMRVLEGEGVEAAQSGCIKDALFISNTADITALEAYKNGLFHVMDQGSMAAVIALNPRPGDTVMDVCAAPGGKSFYAAYMMQNSGKVFSYDIHPHRLKLIEEGAERLGVSVIEMTAADAAAFDPARENSADMLLLDAPCSGFGLLRKKPDIKYSKTPEDVRALAQAQRDMLSVCARYVKPGGVFVYSVCTVSRLETRENMEWFIKNCNFLPEKIENLPPDMVQSNTAADGYAALTPDGYDGDGFFIARFRKIKV